jgi:hypothetical protein
MHLGDRVTRPWTGEQGHHLDDGEEWSDPSALSRGWAAFRLVGLVLLCGLGAGATVGIALWITLTALDSSL